jgi:TonB family protein
MIRYFLLANLYALLLYTGYILFLRNRNNQAWSRFYLLSCVILSIVLPLVKINVTLADNRAMITATQLLPDVILTGKPDSNNVNHKDWALWIYISGSVFLSVYLLYKVLKLNVFLKKQHFREEAGYRIALNTGIGPASFGRAILFPGNEADTGVLKHELGHLRGKHHYDKIFLSLVGCFFFPVAMFYFIRKELETVHEFEADAFAADNQEHYATLLLNQHFYTQQFSLLQPFFHHPIKRRIMMLYSKKATNKKRRGALIIFSAVLVVGGIVFQSQTKLMAQEKTQKHKTGNSDAKEITRENIKETSSENLYYQEKEGDKLVMVDPQQQHSGKEAFTSVEQMPEFPGGRDSLMSFLAKNIRYPEKAKKDHVEGKIIAQFIVNEEGKIEDINILRNLRQDCDAEVVRVLNSMPVWKAGLQDGKKARVYYTLPVNFYINEAKPFDIKK